MFKGNPGLIIWVFALLPTTPEPLEVLISSLWKLALERLITSFLFVAKFKFVDHLKSSVLIISAFKLNSKPLFSTSPTFAHCVETTEGAAVENCNNKSFVFFK